jgi:hypothetical protein
MNGPEHYRRAEQLLDLADTYRMDGAVGTAMHLVAAAQVHATLAHTAATALARPIAMDTPARALPGIHQKWVSAAGRLTKESS